MTTVEKLFVWVYVLVAGLAFLCLSFLGWKVVLGAVAGMFLGAVGFVATIIAIRPDEEDYSNEDAEESW